MTEFSLGLVIGLAVGALLGAEGAYVVCEKIFFRSVRIQIAEMAAEIDNEEDKEDDL